MAGSYPANPCGAILGCIRCTRLLLRTRCKCRLHIPYIHRMCNILSRVSPPFYKDRGVKKWSS
nr:MAG TPA: hypothetical protein [Caudoviricetes sp.]